MESSKGHVLIADGEAHIREILKTTLAGAGFECVTAGDAAEAFSTLSTHSFDLAFTDIRMPGSRGARLFEDIRAAHPDVVVIVTAADGAGAAAGSTREGACDCIVKPFTPEHVLLSARRALDTRRLEDAGREHRSRLARTADERAAENRRLFYSMTQVLVHLLDLKIPFNVGHALRVAEKSRYVARELRMDDDGAHRVYLAALLHDVGMILVEDMLLNKRGAWTPDEQRRFMERTSLAEEVLRPILDDREVLRCIRHHGERYDGSGHPDGLRGDLIPLGSRIIAVAEAFDAMTVWRPHRPPRPPQEAIRELGRCASAQFDPQVVAVFADLYDRVFRGIDPSSGEQP